MISPTYRELRKRPKNSKTLKTLHPLEIIHFIHFVQEGKLPPLLPSQPHFVRQLPHAPLSAGRGGVPCRGSPLSLTSFGSSPGGLRSRGASCGRNSRGGAGAAVCFLQAALARAAKTGHRNHGTAAGRD